METSNLASNTTINIVNWPLLFRQNQSQIATTNIMKENYNKN